MGISQEHLQQRCEVILQQVLVLVARSIKKKRPLCDEPPTCLHLLSHLNAVCCANISARKTLNCHNVATQSQFNVLMHLISKHNERLSGKSGSEYVKGHDARSIINTQRIKRLQKCMMHEMFLFLDLDCGSGSVLFRHHVKRKATATVGRRTVNFILI